MPLVNYKCQAGHEFQVFEKNADRWGTCPMSEFSNNAHGTGRTGHVDCKQHVIILSEEAISEEEWLNRGSP